MSSPGFSSGIRNRIVTPAPLNINAGYSAGSFVMFAGYWKAGSRMLRLTGFLEMDPLVDTPSTAFGTVDPRGQSALLIDFRFPITGQDVAGFGRQSQLIIDTAGNLSISVDEGGSAVRWWIDTEWEARG